MYDPKDTVLQQLTSRYKSLQWEFTDETTDDLLYVRLLVSFVI